MTAPLLSRKKLLGYAIEGTMGTAESVTEAMPALVFEPVMRPMEVLTEERSPVGYLGRVKRAPGLRRGELTFQVEIGEDGPFWRLAQICGYDRATGNVLTPTNGPNGDTATFFLWEDGRVKKMRGCAGTFTIEGEVGGRLMANFTVSGIWVEADDAAMPSWNVPSTLPYMVRNGTTTIGASTMPQFASFTYTANANVVARVSPTDVSGIAHFVVTDRNPTLSLDPEARKVADLDSYGLLVAGTQQAVVLKFPGQSTGYEFEINAPKAQRIDITPGDRDGKLTDAIELELQADDGNDEVTIQE